MGSLPHQKGVVFWKRRRRQPVTPDFLHHEHLNAVAFKEEKWVHVYKKVNALDRSCLLLINIYGRGLGKEAQKHTLLS